MDGFQIDPEIVDLLDSLSKEELLSFAELHDEPGDNTHIELSIYAFFIAFKRLGTRELLERAQVRAEGWVGTTPDEHPDKGRRIGILDAMTARLHDAQDNSLGLTHVSDTARRGGREQSQSEELEKFNRIVETLKAYTEATPPGHPERTKTLPLLLRSLQVRYHETKTVSDLDQMIEIGLEFLQDSDEAVWQWLWLEKLREWYAYRYEHTESIEDLDKLIDVCDKLVNSPETSSSDQWSYLAMLSLFLHMRFSRTGSKEDLDNAIEASSRALAAIPSDSDHDRVNCLAFFGNLLGTRSERTRSAEGVDHAIKLMRSAYDATPPNTPPEPKFLEAYARCLGTRYELTGNLEDLDLAIHLTSALLDTSKSGDRLNLLGMLLGRRFQYTGDIQDLHQAIATLRMALDLTPPHDRDRLKLLHHLGTWLGALFERTGETDALYRAISLLQEVVEGMPLNSPDRYKTLTNLGFFYNRKYEETGKIDDLNLAIDTVETALTSAPSNSPVDECLNNLGVFLFKRFERFGNMHDIDRAIACTQEAAEKMSSQHRKASTLGNLGTWLAMRAERTGLLADFDTAVDTSRSAIDSMPVGHSARPWCWNSLGMSLGGRHLITDSIEDINGSIESLGMAVEESPAEHPARVRFLDNLSGYLGRRFRRLGAMEDLDRAITSAEIAIHGIPLGHPDRARSLNNLSLQLHTRFSVAGEDDDFHRAVDAARSAAAATPSEHISYPVRLEHLGELLHQQYERNEKLEDLYEAIKICDMAVKATSVSRSGKASILCTLSDVLESRFDRTKEIKHLDEAIRTIKEAMNHTNSDDHYRARSLINLAGLLNKKDIYTGSDSSEDRAQLVADSMEIWETVKTAPSVRIELGLIIVAQLSSRSDWEEASKIREEMVRLIPLLSPRLLDNADKQRELSRFSGIPSTAAATALNAGKGADIALQVLELGYGVITSTHIEMRSDTDDLERRYPDTAKRFQYLRSQMEASTKETDLLRISEETTWSPSTINRRHMLDKKLDETIEEIRRLPGFERFLLPPAVEEMMATANHGPLVVLNANHYRCDAFIVKTDEICSLCLSDLNWEDIFKMGPMLRTNVTTVLEWLWNAIAQPILEYLGFDKTPSGDKWPHIWWIPVGVLGRFPIHAAGRHFDGSHETVLDRVVSSYSTSVKTLNYGRRRRMRVSTAAEANPKHALLVSMSETPGQSPLPFASEEMNMVRSLCSPLHLQLVEPSENTKAEVLRCLKGCKMFHFAGHGLSDPMDPSQSSLILNDRLTVGDLRQLHLEEDSPFLSYLSACSTGVMSTDGTLIDEGIHLVNACQLAGFRHVVGTLWEVSDAHCVEIARTFYETLCNEGLTDDAVSLGLHRAIRKLRDMDRQMVNCRSQEGDLDEPHDFDNASKDATEGSKGTDSAPNNGGSNPDRRNAVPKRHRKKPASMYWVPYVHYGV